MTAPTRTRTFKLSPSALPWWDACPHCFYLKTHGLARLPGLPLPAAFHAFDKGQRGFLHQKRTSLVSPSLPGGHLHGQEQAVCSHEIALPGHEATCYVKGRLDLLAVFDEGGYGVIDCKTRSARAKNTHVYERQLQAYAYCLEHPADSSPLLAPVTHLGLLCFDFAPRMERVLGAPPPQLRFLADQTYVPCEPDAAAFLALIGEVLGVLEQPGPPSPAKDCGFCAYRYSPTVAATRPALTLVAA